MVGVYDSQLRHSFHQALLTCRLQENVTPSFLHGITFQHSQQAFDHVGGLEEVKEALAETYLWPSRYPQLFAQVRLRSRSGLLLYGPPG